MLLFRPPLLKFGRAGVRVSDIAVGGDQDSPLYNDFTLPADADKIALWALLPPLLDATSGGTTEVDDQGGYSHAGAADGEWRQDYRLLVMPPSGATEVSEASIFITVGSGGSTYEVAAVESASASDAMSAAATMGAALAESATASDSVSAVAQVVAAVSETLSAADAITVSALFEAATTEAASASEQTNWGGGFYTVELAETATVADAVSCALQALAAMSEAASAIDTPAVILSAGAAVVEAASAADAITGANPTSYSVSLAEASSALDAITVTLNPGGLVVLSAPPAGRRLQTGSRPTYAGGRRPTYKGGTR